MVPAKEAPPMSKTIEKKAAGPADVDRELVMSLDPTGQGRKKWSSAGRQP